MSEAPTCPYVPYGSSACGRVLRLSSASDFCHEHEGRKCVVCGKQATHMCGGWIGSFVCGADVCDTCDNYQAGVVHLCGARPTQSVTVDERRAHDERRSREIREAGERFLAAQARGTEEQPPDPRNEADYWTAGKLAQEHRPRQRQDGSGGPRKLWAVCEACGVQRQLDPAKIAPDAQILRLRLRCQCGGHGHAKLTWVNVPKVKQEGPTSPKLYGKPRPGHYDFSTGERRGAWD